MEECSDKNIHNYDRNGELFGSLPECIRQVAVSVLDSLVPESHGSSIQCYAATLQVY